LYRIEQELGTEIQPIPQNIDRSLYVAPSSISDEVAQRPNQAQQQQHQQHQHQQQPRTQAQAPPIKNGQVAYTSNGTQPQQVRPNGVSTPQARGTPVYRGGVPVGR